MIEARAKGVALKYDAVRHASCPLCALRSADEVHQPTETNKKPLSSLYHIPHELFVLLPRTLQRNDLPARRRRRLVAAPPQRVPRPLQHHQTHRQRHRHHTPPSHTTAHHHSPHARAPRSKKKACDYSCGDGPVTAVECCVDAAGCVKSVAFYHLDRAKPAKEASCEACGAADAVTRVTLDGELIVGYDVDVKKWAAGYTSRQRCVAAITFKTSCGRALRCGAGAAPGGGRRKLLNPPAQPTTVKPPKPPGCLRAATKPKQPATALCGLVATRCATDEKGGKALNYIKPLWAFQASQCAFPPEAVAWSCAHAVLTCKPAGSAVRLAGLCTTNVSTTAVVQYSVAGGGAPVTTETTCPASGTLTITPSLVTSSCVAGECQSTGPAVLLKLDTVNPPTGARARGFTSRHGRRAWLACRQAAPWQRPHAPWPARVSPIRRLPALSWHTFHSLRSPPLQTRSLRRRRPVPAQPQRHLPQCPSLHRRGPERVARGRVPRGRRQRHTRLQHEHRRGACRAVPCRRRAAGRVGDAGVLGKAQLHLRLGALQPHQ